ncbi:MBL fold metallo-hydrolase [Knoellia remsis]|nr:MBL fold metallo-hydrolase [Knoellia remsis]
MRVTIVGCSGSFAGPSSPASSYLVQADDGERTWNVLLDLGSGALGALQRHLDPAAVDALFLSHLHPDHCSDVTGLYVTRKYRPEGELTVPLPVFGPKDTADQLVRMYHGASPDEVARHFEVTSVEDGAVVEVGPFRITPYAVNHPVEAYGYRVEAGGRVLAFTGDTDSCDALGGLLGGADLALMDAAFVEGRDETRGIHLTAARAAQAALDAGGVERLMLTHLPPWNDPETARAEAAAVWTGEVELADPDATYDV